MFPDLNKSSWLKQNVIYLLHIYYKYYYIYFWWNDNINNQIKH